MRPTLQLLLNILVFELGALVRHYGGRIDLGDVLVVIFVVDECVISGARAMCGLPRGESTAQTLDHRTGVAAAGWPKLALVKATEKRTFALHSSSLATSLYLFSY
jgi:hypothetical protein